MKKYLILNCSLNPGSRSRVLARLAFDYLQQKDADVEFVDLRDLNLPTCDGDAVYSDPGAQEIAAKVQAADWILLGVPIYNFDVNAAAKNLIELTGRAWTEKVAGFLCAAGGQGSYMSVMAVANSLMLDFRTVVIPRFVYATGAAFQGEDVSDPDLQGRVEELAGELVRFAEALR